MGGEAVNPKAYPLADAQVCVCVNEGCLQDARGGH